MVISELNSETTYLNLKISIEINNNKDLNDPSKCTYYTPDIFNKAEL